MTARGPGAAVLLLVAAAACGGAPSEQAGPAPRDALIAIERPDPAVMETDVATLIDARWEELEAARADEGASGAELSEAYARFGLACFANGLEIPAAAAIENASRLAPEDARWIYMRALLDEAAGRLEEAAAGFERVLELRPGDLPALMHLGDVRLDQSRLEEARDAFRGALDVDPESAAAHYGLGRVAAAEGDELVAVSHYETALELQPGASRLHYLLALAQRNLGNDEAAERHLALRGAVEPVYDDPLLDAIPGGSASERGTWGHMRAGGQAYVDGAYDLAVEEFRAATRDHADDPRSWQSLGMALAKTGAREEAKAAYAEALALGEANAVVHHDLALLLIEEGGTAEAERRLVRAIEIDPGLLEAHTALARLLADSGRLEAALARFDAALALDAQAEGLAVARAEVLVRLGRAGEALGALAEAAEAAPLDAAVRAAYGTALADAGRTGEAIRELEQARVVAPAGRDAARVLYALGRVRLATGDAPGAARDFSAAIEADPEHRPARLAHARALGVSGELTGALAAYAKILERDPGDLDARIEAAGTALLLERVADARALLDEGSAGPDVAPRQLSALARLLAIAPDPAVRDPGRALSVAERAFEAERSPQHVETVALCLAALGRHEEAVALQERLVAEAERRAGPAVRERLAGNLARYREGQLGRLPLDAR